LLASFLPRSSIADRPITLKSQMVRFQGSDLGVPSWRLAQATCIQDSSADFLIDTGLVWSKTCVLNPGCVFTPSDERDIAQALGFIEAAQTKFSVRSGGHMPVIGAQSNNDGVLIALTNLKTLKYNNDKSVLSIGPGYRWIDVYEFTSLSGLGVAGGRYGQVGVGGLLTGGGISYFGNKIGWSFNTLVSVQIVLGNGTIVEASATKNSDLFWALKGGNNNYGIVTRFDLKTFQVKAVYAGGTVWDGRENVQPVANAIQNFILPGGGIEDPETELNPSIEVHPHESERLWRSYYLPFVNGTYSSPPRSIENFTSIQATPWYNTVGQRDDWVSLAREVSSVDNNLRREQFRALALKNVPGVVDLAVNVVLKPAMEDNKWSRLKQVNGSVVSVAYQPISKQMLQAAKRSGDAFDLDPADGSFMGMLILPRPYLSHTIAELTRRIVILIATNWLDAQWDDLMYSYSEDAAKRLKAKAKELGVFYDFVYLNDAAGGQNPYATFGKGKSLPRMQKIQKAYDPKKVIKNLMTSGFKLP